MTSVLSDFLTVCLLVTDRMMWKWHLCVYGQFSLKQSTVCTIHRLCESYDAVHEAHSSTEPEASCRRRCEFSCPGTVLLWIPVNVTQLVLGYALVQAVTNLCIAFCWLQYHFHNTHVPQVRHRKGETPYWTPFLNDGVCYSFDLLWYRPIIRSFVVQTLHYRFFSLCISYNIWSHKQSFGTWRFSNQGYDCVPV